MHRREADVAVIKQKSVVSAAIDSSLQALTAAALALPGLMLSSANAADEEFSMQYGHYQENGRHIGVKKAFKPIEVDSIFGSAKIKFSDRVKFAFNYTQDTWGGATPVTTAPIGFKGNRLTNAIVGATPYVQGGPGNLYFNKKFKPMLLSGYDEEGNPLYKVDNRVVHTLSQASPETRKQGDFKLGYEWDEAEINVGGGVSLENDYESRFGNLSGRMDFNQKLTSLNLGLSYTNSDTRAILDHDSYVSDVIYRQTGQVESITTGGFGQSILHGNRQDWATNLGLTQVINKDALLGASVGYTRSTGYMSNPYKGVTFAFVDPLQVPNAGLLSSDVFSYIEKRPDERNQWTVNLDYVHHINFFDAALHFDYRFFSDDWGIDAHTFEADWRQALGYGWSVTPRIRYYSQEAADFYQPYILVKQKSKGTPNSNAEFVSNNYTNYSSDQRLSGFGALSGGVTISKQFAKGITLDAGFEYYTHAGAMKIGGGGEADYADFNYWVASAAMKVDLATLAASGGDHSHHREHHNHANRAPAGVMFSHMMPKAGGLMVGYRYMYGNQSGVLQHGINEVSDADIVAHGCQGNPCYVAPDEMSMHMHMVDLMYAPTSWLNLMLMPQFVDMEMSFRRLEGAPTPPSAITSGLGAAVIHAGHPHTTGGIGDTGMYALIKLLDIPRHHVHLSLGLSAPTGDVGIKLRRTHQKNLGFIHYGMQLGSGTWDFKPSLTYTGQNDAWSWGAQMSGTYRMEDKNESGFAFGDIFQATAWGSYGLSDWLSASVRGVYTDQGPINLQYNDVYHQIGPMDYTNNYGGKYWDVGFGLNAYVPKGDLAGNNLSLEWIQPVEDDVNGYQLPREGALSLTWGYAF